MLRFRSIGSLTLLSASLFAASPFAAITAFAADGVIELNQTCASAGECVRGDDPGFPITIDGADGRSYRLTSDLLVGDANTSGIEIAAAANGVSIDLNGFSIRGVTSCTEGGSTLSCAPLGAGVGIRSFAVGIRIHDGHISAMGNNGVQVSSGSLIESVTVSENGNFGFGLGSSTTIKDSTSRRNGSHGFILSQGNTAQNCTSDANGGDGYAVSSGVQVHGSAARANGGAGFQSIGTTANLQNNTSEFNSGHGIRAGAHSTIRNNTVRDNQGTGITAGDSSVIEGNTVGESDGVGIDADSGAVISNNAVSESGEGGIVAGSGSVIRGNSVFDNGTDMTHDGISCTLGCRVQDNTIRSNGGFGLRFNSNSSGYSGNSISANGAGNVTLGRDTGGNVCGTSTSCP